MQCPKCKSVDLRGVTVKKTGVRVDSCRQCKGVWFDAEELESLLDVAAKELEIPLNAEKSVSSSCPRCGKPLFHFQYPQTYVYVDMCKKCGGLWLDAGEFNEVKAVRQSLEKTGQLEEYAPPAGVKGGLIRFIDVALEAFQQS